MNKVYFLEDEKGLITPFASLCSRNNIELSPIEAVNNLSSSSVVITTLAQSSLFAHCHRVILYSASDIDKEKDLLKKLSELDTTVGLFELSSETFLYSPIIRSINNKLNERNRLLKLAQMSEELNNLEEKIRTEITKVKKIHEQLVPIRSEELKGVKIFSKYAAGESIGGEFFDFYQDKHQLFFLLSSSTSYLLSSTIISRLEVLKSSTLTDKSIQEMILGILSDADSLEVKDIADRNALDLLAIKIDLVSMSVNGYRFGGGEIVAETQVPSLPLVKERSSAFLNQANFSFGLQQSDKLLFMSSGVRHNSQGEISGQPIHEFMRKELANSPKEILNELFFQLKKDRSSDFLKYDASAIYIEVNRNGIFKI